jgi:ribosomal RNA-processing protein 36
VRYKDCKRIPKLRPEIGEEKELVMKARYETLAKEGGQGAVKKAIEKRQKKISQKEKRTRPYVEERPNKRPRV